MTTSVPFRFVLLIVFLFVLGSTGRAQTYGHVDNKIYNAVLADYREDEKEYNWKFRVSIVTKTSLDMFKKFDVKHPNYHSLDTNRSKLDNEWWSFLRAVDTAKIGQATVDVSGIRFKNRHLKISNKSHDVIFWLSPQIISDDTTKAVFCYTEYSGPENSAGYAVLLEKRNGIWEVFQHIMLYIS